MSSFVSTAETAQDESLTCSDSISPDLHRQTSVRGQSCQADADRLLPNIDEAKQKHKADILEGQTLLK